MIALDYDVPAQKIAEAGYELAKSMNAQITLLHVIADKMYYSSFNYSPMLGYESFNNLNMLQVTTDNNSIHNAAKDYLNKTKQHLGDDTIETIIKEGDFGECIVEAANESHADIIVLGSHGRRGLDKFLIGDIAEQVLHKSTIPLYIIPTKGLENLEATT